MDGSHIIGFLSIASIENMNTYVGEDGLTRDIDPIRNISAWEQLISLVVGAIPGDCSSSVHHHRLGLHHCGFYHTGFVDAVFYIRFA